MRLFSWSRRKLSRPILLTHELEAKAVPVVSSAMIASTGISEGRMMPLLILDTSQRPDIEDMIRAHEHLGPGDVLSDWALPTWETLELFLTFERPSRCVIRIAFNVLVGGGLIDNIMLSQALYLQAGRPGDRLAGTMDALRVVVEIPTGTVRHRWEEVMERALVKDYRAKGLSKRDAKKAARGVRAEWRELISLRMKSEHDHPTE